MVNQYKQKIKIFLLVSQKLPTLIIKPVKTELGSRKYIYMNIKESPGKKKTMYWGFQSFRQWGLSWHFFRTNLHMHTNALEAALNKKFTHTS